MSSKKLSATMAIALAETIDHGGELVCWQGGYWTYPNCSIYEERGGYRVPIWNVGTDTVRALVSRGYFEVIGYSLGAARLPVRIRAKPLEN
jgi:hypothetical protein